MTKHSLKVIDDARRMLWVMEYKNIKLDIGTKDPILQKEIELLKKHRDLIEKTIESEGKLLNSSIFKHEQLNDQNNSHDFIITLIKRDPSQFEVRSIVFNENYELNDNNFKRDFEIIDLSTIEKHSEDKITGYIILHSVGIVYGKVTGCYDASQSVRKIFNIIENIIYDAFIFN